MAAPQSNYPQASATSPANKVQVMCDRALWADDFVKATSNFSMAGVNALAEAFNTVNNYTQDPTICNFLSANNSDTHRVIGLDEFAWNF